jgi:hypothetical protein
MLVVTAAATKIPMSPLKVYMGVTHRIPPPAL